MRTPAKINTIDYKNPRDKFSNSVVTNKGGASHRELGEQRHLMPTIVSGGIKSVSQLQTIDGLDPKVSKKLFGSITVEDMA